MEIMTHKSSKFVFTLEYDKLAVEPLVAEVRTLADFILDLRVMPYRSKIDEELIIRSIMSTAAIEGNPLTEEEVKKVVESNVAENKYQQEIINLKDAYEYINKLKIDEVVITEDLIKDIHAIVTKNIQHEYNVPGYYRQESVKVGDANHGGIYVPPKCLDDIKMLMTAFVSWFSELPETMSPFVRAFMFHYYFAKIHPFSDGNGRTARILEGIILKKCGYGFLKEGMSNNYYKTVDEYYLAYSKSHAAGNSSEFLLYCLEVAKRTLLDFKKQAVSFAKRFALRDFIQHCYKHGLFKNRESDLLNLLLDTRKEFNKNDLFIESDLCLIYGKLSPKTASNDLNRLTRLGFLLKRGDKYKLNINVLAHIGELRENDKAGQ